jgi:hypothetical protein
MRPRSPYGPPPAYASLYHRSPYAAVSRTSVDVLLTIQPQSFDSRGLRDQFLDDA